MLSARPAAETSTQLASGIGTQIGISAGTQLALSVFAKLLGASYSTEDQKKLTELERVYGEALGQQPPVFWCLDEKNRPIYRIQSQKSFEYARQLRASNHHKGNFPYQSSLIAEYVVTYLSERSKRWFGKGQPGDLLEQFMSEWIDFSLKELPNLSFDAAAMNKIEQRIKYLEKIQKHEALFKFGFIARDRNKFDTMESIRQLLKRCQGIVAKESLRQCAREKFQTCRVQTGELLHASVSLLYYARATPLSNEPFNLQGFVDREAFLSVPARELYAKIKTSHTGAMLAEVISVTGLEAFGDLNTGESLPRVACYFDEMNKPRAITEWPKNTVDLPPWVKAAEEEQNYLIETQHLLESILRLAELKKLVEEAYDLTGKVGDLWAYGDKQGKLSLVGLLFLLENELDVFHARYEKLHQKQNNWRVEYNRHHRINPDTKVNFNKVDQQKDKMDELYLSLKTAVKDIREKMKEFTEEEASRIDARKKVFYQSIARYFKQYYSKEKYEEYQTLENPTPTLGYHTFDLESPLLDLSRQAITVSALEYGKWKKDYARRHKMDYENLKSLLQQFNENASLAQLSVLAKTIQEQLGQMKLQAEDERPAWRLSFSGLRLGYPFHQRKHHYIDLVNQECELIADNILTTLNEVTEQAKPPTMAVIPRPSLRGGHNEASNTNHYTNNPSTVFNDARMDSQRRSALPTSRPLAQQSTNPFCY